MRRKCDKVKLTKKGIFGESWSKKLKDHVLEGIRVEGKKGEFFWANRNTFLTLDKGVTLIDLINIMAKMNVEELHALSCISNANLAPYLIEFSKHPDPIPDTDMWGKLTAIEVYRVMELSNWTNCDDVYDLNDYTCAHGIGEIWETCIKDVESGKAKLKDIQDCNTYAIEFTPWQKMLNLPIQIREFIYYSENEWKKCKSRPFNIKVLGKKKKYKMGNIDREIVKKNRYPEKKIRTSLSLGQFFTGLFNELCFFGSPVDREKEENVLKERYEKVETIIKK